MKYYKHYSFDLWLTLIKSNPNFKRERAVFFYKNFNSKKKNLEEIISIFRNIDLMCNLINEKTGKNIDPEEMYLIVINTINDYDNKFHEIDLEDLYCQMEVIFFNYMPFIYDSETYNTLDKLKQKSNSSFNISSNTGFVKGGTLRKILVDLNLDSFFEFQLYSDEVGVSKPNRSFFEEMINNVKKIPSKKNIQLNEIVHIGDNPVADIKGALSTGIDSILINSNSINILSVLN
jgi:putative hydrolase of the HAD superfamily